MCFVSCVLQELWNATLPPQQRGRSHSMDVARRLIAGGAAGMCACTVVSSLTLRDDCGLIFRLHGYPGLDVIDQLWPCCKG